MALGSAYGIVWLDSHIGSPDHCEKMKTQFLEGLAEAAAVPPLRRDPIDDLICAVREYSAPILFAATEEDALTLIENQLVLKKVIFITSATLGKKIIPKIMKNSLQIEAYYIFCANMKDNRDWATGCIDDGLDLQMFDHQTDLLVRLCRDMSKILIEEGKLLLNANNSSSALTYFEYAYALAEKAVEYDKPINESDRHKPSTNHRQVLDDLISQAKRAME